MEEPQKKASQQELQTSPLRLVNTETGEWRDGDELQKALDDALIENRKLQGELTGKRLQIAQLEKDREAEARRGGKWVRALAHRRYWEEKCGHRRTEMSLKLFLAIEPFLDKYDDEAIREAIRGIASSDFHMKRGAYAERKGGKYDKWADHIFKDDDRFLAFREMDPEMPSLSRQTMVELADDVAERVLERAELIRSDNDPRGKAELLVEIWRRLEEWRKAPLQPDDESA